MMARTCALRYARASVLAPLLAILMLNGCAQFAAVSEAVFMMSPEQEVKLGSQMREQINQEMTVVNDPEVNRFINAMGQRLYANAPDRGVVEPRFHVVRDDSLNAFAVPGGDIYVHTGLIKAVDDEAELAAVVAHELGHVIRRHGARQVSRNMGMQLLEQALLGEAGQATQIVSQLLQTGVMFNYSRDDEREADQIAVHAMHRTGLDPMALRSFFGKLQAQSGGGGGGIPTFLSTHPPTAERMQNVQNLVQSLPARQYQRPTSEINRIKARL